MITNLTRDVRKSTGLCSRAKLMRASKSSMSRSQLAPQSLPAPSGSGRFANTLQTRTRGRRRLPPIVRTRVLFVNGSEGGGSAPPTEPAPLMITNLTRDVRKSTGLCSRAKLMRASKSSMSGASSLRSPSRRRPPGLPGNSHAPPPGDGTGVSARPFRYNGAEPCRRSQC